MNLLRSLFVVTSSFFIIFKKTSGTESNYQYVDVFFHYYTFANKFSLPNEFFNSILYGSDKIFLKDEEVAALAIVIKGSAFLPAIPEEYDWSNDMVTYNYDEELGEKFETGCPAPDNKLTPSEEQWLERNVSKEGNMLTVGLDNDEKKNCHNKAKPSILKTGTICGSSESEFYDVGYPVIYILFL